MDPLASRRTTVVDAEGRSSLSASGLGDERLLCTFETFPDVEGGLHARFPEADILSIVPHHEGPWHAAVGMDLDALESVGVRAEGVPLLDCFRAAWRDHLTALRSLEFGLAGERRPRVTSGGPSIDLLLGTAEAGDLDEVEVLASPPRALEHGLLSKVRRAGLRGVAMALSSRLDPAGDRRAHLRLRPRVADARALIVSSYVNPTRSALEALEATGGGPAILLCTGPGATGDLALPPDLVRMPLHAALALDRRRPRALRSSHIPDALESLRAWDATQPGWKPWSALRRTSFGRRLASVHLAEALSVIVAVQAIVSRSGVRTLIVGDEFSFGDRAALHAGRHLGLETISRQHGVLDSHYLRDRILSERHLAWNPETVQWLESHDAVAGRSVVVLPRATRVAPRRRGLPDSVVVFLQPTGLLRVPFDEWMRATLPPVVRAAEALGLRALLKAHPLQSRAEVLSCIPQGLRGRAALVDGVPASALLSDAAAAVVLDSSVCLEAMEADVPCLSTAWYRTPYGADLARLGYVTPCGTPAELESLLRARARRAAPA